MRLMEISDKEFEKFAKKHEQVTFHQTKQWGELKKTNGWKSYLIGMKDKDKVVAAALLLAKKIPVFNRYMFYSPRGFLIDYKDKNLLKEFTNQIKEFVKNKKGIFIKIDPYVPYKEHDNNGKLVENGFDNSDVVNNLKELGYKHFGFNLMQDTLQPRWMHVIDTDRSMDDVLKDMESKTRQILRKNEKCGIITHEIEKDELKTFKEIMKHTSDRREFVDRPFSYYENMWDKLHDSGILKIRIAEIDFNLYEKNTNNEKNEIENALKDRIRKYENKELKMNEKKYNSHNKQDEERIKQLEKQLEKIKEYKKEYGEKTTLGGILFLVYGNEVLSLYGGSEAKLMQFQSAYTVHFDGIKYAVENGYKRYNFYGITGDFREENPLYGLYLFKKSFGGTVVELVGEFDLITNKFWYNTYKLAFGTYHKFKNITKKIKH
ncbi:MAG: peptidoglycan bridge formation glycyltransferase FemA/FemB family protein [Bacilli bacterium]|nr:peptidoglycan bridge formation glycyltransferase FemA/FemB family protein [Bacilli bacterium]